MRRRQRQPLPLSTENRNFVTYLVGKLKDYPEVGTISKKTGEQGDAAQTRIRPRSRPDRTSTNNRAARRHRRLP
jgi:hypothetical protein